MQQVGSTAISWYSRDGAPQQADAATPMHMRRQHQHHKLKLNWLRQQELGYRACRKLRTEAAWLLQSAVIALSAAVRAERGACDSAASAPVRWAIKPSCVRA